MKEIKELINPFQYGYSSYWYEALIFVAKHFGTTVDELRNCHGSNIIVRYYEREEKQRYLKALGK